MDPAAKGSVSESIAECEALLHALLDEASSPDGAESAAMLVEALVRKGRELRDACSETEDGSVRRASEWVELAGNQLVTSPSDLTACTDEFRRRLEELRNLAVIAEETSDHPDDSRRVAVLCQGDDFIGVPLDAIGMARVASRRDGGGSIEIAFSSERGGGSIRVNGVHSFVVMDRVLVEGAGVWPGALSLSDGHEARIVDRAESLAPSPAVETVTAEETPPAAPTTRESVSGEADFSLVSTMTPLNEAEGPSISGPR